ncbi:hypothetical protein V5P93_000650 [Actinokineospora auranticolor]|uniref:Uncharacterized protein n=1 Tax=Actinokineospora auranticolor TaxID=155976 RepID=A0A2S6GZ08_9PSEU|nr:hypothetical protein [Actinokineospora auranticolor]PPK70469.1 hypothetical protein CLV40_102384 [Actinokineospora auranticolor]
MGTYVSIRGWLECDDKQLVAIQEVISSHDDGDFYSGGWGFPRKPFNWTRYVFYGGDIRESTVDWFLGQLGEIARIPASDEDNDLVRGLFHARHEVNGTSEWQVRAGQVFISPADARYGYLDE